jgi:FkbM family methyltransferase
MNYKQRIRKSIRHFGVDVVRYPLHDPMARIVKLLAHHRINCVVDIGANDGGFATAIRGSGYSGRIISFEPLLEPFEKLRKEADSDRNWDVHRCAVGATSDEVTIHVSGDAGKSSSVLPMLPSHTSAAPNSRQVGTQTVRQERLDQLLPQLAVRADSRVFLKIDVEGYENAVLDGAAGVFADGQVVGLQLELSFVPLYRGAMTYREGLDRAEALGMRLMGLDPVFADDVSGQLLQADAVFFAE